MAQVDDNDLTLGLRGKIGKQLVFRKLGKATIASRRSRPGVALTEKQLAHREDFRLATLYAKRSLMKPELKEEYQAIARAKHLSSAFAEAVADYLKPIEIQGILTESYDGKADFHLPIVVGDRYKIKTMKVTITDASGALVETGEAAMNTSSSGFTYVTTVTVQDPVGLTIKVEATDRPGNVVVHEVTLS
jgi:hypothetical protein